MYTRGKQVFLILFSAFVWAGLMEAAIEIQASALSEYSMRKPAAQDVDHEASPDSLADIKPADVKAVDGSAVKSISLSQPPKVTPANPFRVGGFDLSTAKKLESELKSIRRKETLDANSFRKLMDDEFSDVFLKDSRGEAQKADFFKAIDRQVFAENSGEGTAYDRLLAALARFREREEKAARVSAEKEDADKESDKEKKSETAKDKKEEKTPGFAELIKQRQEERKKNEGNGDKPSQTASNPPPPVAPVPQHPPAAPPAPPPAAKKNDNKDSAMGMLAQLFSKPREQPKPENTPAAEKTEPKKAAAAPETDGGKKKEDKEPEPKKKVASEPPAPKKDPLLDAAKEMDPMPDLPPPGKGEVSSLPSLPSGGGGSASGGPSGPNPPPAGFPGGMGMGGMGMGMSGGAGSSSGGDVPRLDENDLRARSAAGGGGPSFRGAIPGTSAAGGGGGGDGDKDDFIPFGAPARNFSTQGDAITIYGGSGRGYEGNIFDMMRGPRGASMFCELYSPLADIGVCNSLAEKKATRQTDSVKPTRAEPTL